MGSDEIGFIVRSFVAYFIAITIMISVATFAGLLVVGLCFAVYLFYRVLGAFLGTVGVAAIISASMVFKGYMKETRY